MSTVLKGQSIDLDAVQKFLNAEVQRWLAEHPVGSPVTFTDISKFLMESTDDLVVLVQGLIFNGADKKATVLTALGTLYDTTIAPNLPTWAKPFGFAIKFALINIVASGLIDYIVQKYNNGSVVTTALSWQQAKIVD